jgi:hypothetical protein
MISRLIRWVFATMISGHVPKRGIRFGTKVKTEQKCRCSLFVTSQQSSTEARRRFSTVRSCLLDRFQQLLISRVGYGGFSISINPFFSSTILTFLQTYGAILAVPSIRGGSEFGEEWHKAGIREKKVCPSAMSLLPTNSV